MLSALKEQNANKPKATQPEDKAKAPSGAAPDKPGKTNSAKNGDHDFTSSNWDTVWESFDDMNLKDDLLRGVYAYGFEKPSTIQSRAIMPVIQGKDTIAQAQSGTGKTGTFCISALQRLEPGVRDCQALILAPTRELAQQIFRVLNALGQYVTMSSRACVGGTAVREDLQALRKGVQIVVGTPGRVNDMLSRNALRLHNLRMFIMDEADEMLSRGFKHQIYDVFEFLPPDVQVCLFSATLPIDILEITKPFMRNPVRILVKAEQLTLEGIRQFYIAVDQECWKLDTLCDLYENLTISQAIIYCNTRQKTERLYEEMTQRDFTVSAMHGDMEQTDRQLIMQEFRSGSTRVLITTDLLARGIDVQQVSLVINYDLPSNRENYLHRIGRSGRFGKKGVAINFVTRDDVRQLREIENYYGTQVEELPEDIGELMG